MLTGDGIGDGLLGREVLLLDLDVGDALDTPADTQVFFLMLPVFGEDGAPQGAGESIDWREIAKEEP